MIFALLFFIVHLLQNSPDNSGFITMLYQVTVELRSRECYEALSLEAASERGLTYTDIDRINIVSIN